MSRASSSVGRRKLSCTVWLLPLCISCADPADTPPPSTASLAATGTDWATAQATDLVRQMTLTERIGQLQHNAPAIERLGLPAYNYWSEGLHGVLTDRATSFPSPIALGASFNPSLVERVATAISDEARGIRKRDGKGLTYWSPVINILRDPRWGRYDESFTEDPWLMSRMGTAFIRGLQGDDPKYLKAVATPKHFALNNSEFNRHSGSSDADKRLLFEYYLPAFEAAVTEGHAFSVMSAYNRVNGVPASGNTWLLEDTLRGAWGFPGYVVSDCDAVSDILSGHHYTESLAEAAALALNAGTDLNCGISYPSALGTAIEQGLTTEAAVERALVRVLRARVLLGEFAPPEEVPFQSITPDVIESEAHRALALEAARASIVLLKNEGNLLPLSRDNLSSIAVIGPHGSTVTLGSYSGAPSHQVSALSALQEKLAGAPAVSVTYAEGTPVSGTADLAALSAAAETARNADVALVFVGTDLGIFREEMDRPDWSLPGAQQDLIAAVYAANPRTVVVLVTGGPVGVDWAKANVPALLTTFYNGQEQGTAIADVLFGDVNPGGKLSTTWYRGDAILPDIGDYDIRKGRTYLYYEEEPLFPFGYGMSYTEFDYSNLTATPTTLEPEGTIQVTFDVTNTGSRQGDEIAQLYVRAQGSSVSRPLQQLRGFLRVGLASQETRQVTLPIGPKDLSYYDESQGMYRVEAGQYELRLGASSADIRGTVVIDVKSDFTYEAGGAAGSPTSPGSSGSAGNDATGNAGSSNDASAATEPGSPDLGCSCHVGQLRDGSNPAWLSLAAMIGLGVARRRRGS